MLLPHAGSILEAHERLAPAVDAGALAEAVVARPRRVARERRGDDPEAYVDYLSRRLRSGAFAAEAEAERVRAGA